MRTASWSRTTCFLSCSSAWMAARACWCPSKTRRSRTATATWTFRATPNWAWRCKPFAWCARCSWPATTSWLKKAWCPTRTMTLRWPPGARWGCWRRIEWVGVPEQAPEAEAESNDSESDSSEQPKPSTYIDPFGN